MISRKTLNSSVGDFCKISDIALKLCKNLDYGCAIIETRPIYVENLISEMWSVAQFRFAGRINDSTYIFYKSE